MGLHQTSIYFVGDTVGQAETAVLGCKELINGKNKLNSNKVLFHNIDTIVLCRDIVDIDNQLDKSDGFIDVFVSDKPIYSYVKIDESNRVIEMKEKIVISEYATSGLYGFKDINSFVEYYYECSYSGEFYISDIYNKMLIDKKIISISLPADNKSTIILGTPKEYEEYSGKVE